jgi:hypothetical protein
MSIPAQWGWTIGAGFEYVEADVARIAAQITAVEKLLVAPALLFSRRRQGQR